MKEFWKTIDTVVIGRKTYEPVLKSGTPFPTYPGVKNYVLSRTLKECPDQNVEIIAEDAAEFIRKLKMEEGKDNRQAIAADHLKKKPEEAWKPMIDLFGSYVIFEE